MTTHCFFNPYLSYKGHNFIADVEIVGTAAEVLGQAGKGEDTGAHGTLRHGAVEPWVRDRQVPGHTTSFSVTQGLNHEGMRTLRYLPK